MLLNEKRVIRSQVPVLEFACIATFSVNFFTLWDSMFT